MLKVWQFFLTKGQCCPLVKDNERVNKKDLELGSFKKWISSSNIMNLGSKVKVKEQPCIG